MDLETLRKQFKHFSHGAESFSVAVGSRLPRDTIKGFLRYIPSENWNIENIDNKKHTHTDTYTQEQRAIWVINANWRNGIHVGFHFIV